MALDRPREVVAQEAVEYFKSIKGYLKIGGISSWGFSHGDPENDPATIFYDALMELREEFEDLFLSKKDKKNMEIGSKIADVFCMLTPDDSNKKSCHECVNHLTRDDIIEED